MVEKSSKKLLKLRGFGRLDFGLKMGVGGFLSPLILG